MFQLSGPSFLSHYPASSLGIKICTPANKPWAIWWRTVWAPSAVVYIQYKPWLLNTFNKTCKYYLDCEKSTVWNCKQAILVLPQKGLVTEFCSQHLSLFFLTDVSDYLRIFVAVLFIKMRLHISHQSSSEWIIMNLTCSRFLGPLIQWTFCCFAVPDTVFRHPLA